MISRVSSLSLAMIALIFTLTTGCARAASQSVRYDVTSVEAVQLSNAVQITISTNGQARFNMDKWLDGNYYYDPSKTWPDMMVESKVIGMNLPNARSQVGDYIFIGKYPVSHIELSTPPEREIRSGQQVGLSLDIVVHLYAGAVMRSVDTGDSSGSNASGISSASRMFDVMPTPDQRGIIVTVLSDQRVNNVERRDPESVPDSDRELTVTCAEGLLNVHACNAKLSQLLACVTKLTGMRIQMDDSLERLVSAELPRITPEDMVDKIADCYGLQVTELDGALVLSDALSRTGSAYISGETYRLPVYNTKAETARELLPTFLTQYVGIDTLHNELIVSGSRSLTEKIAADLKHIDKPAPTVAVKVRLLEITSDVEGGSSFALSGSNAGLHGSFDGGAGNLVFSKIEGTQDEVESHIHWLLEKGKAVMRSEATVMTTSGKPGQFFAGINKYILTLDRWGDTNATSVEAGTRIAVTPRVGNNTILLSLSADIKQIERVDPVTNLPTVISRNLSGSYRIQPGDTLLVGGLSQDQEYVTVRKLPILGSLPLIGGLFRSKSRSHSKSEMIILITPALA